ncbi:unnamed protein product [Mytilus edulis]|uniref:Uncharacterized protein n=1 Tax=Mytilus edulis TaxID=6550 RepID=A0A8S3UAP7_MYTED|nr:unnamed protein product [Mytilus edulis]
MLRSKLWSGLRDPLLKNASRYKCDTVEKFDQLLKEIRSIELDLSNYASGSDIIRFNINLRLLNSQSKIFMIPLLVVSLIDYNKNVPIIIGTHVIRLLDTCSMVDRQQTNIDKIPREWDIAFNSIKDEATGQVYSTNKNPIKINPLSVLNVSGLARTVVTESLSDDLSYVSVCPRVVNVKDSTRRVPVRIFNMTAKAMVIKPKTHLCSLNEVKVVRHVDFQSAESAVEDEKSILSDQELSSLGINLENFMHLFINL